MSSGGDVDPSPPPPPGGKPRLQSPLDYRNGDLVSRLLAATPPYLYNMPMVPHSFFFSEMLRSFVQAKSDAPPPPPPHRRSRKRGWRDAKPSPPPPPADKPLELTTRPTPPPASPPVLPPPLLLPPCGLLPPPPASDSSGLPLPPPPPPLWYPPLYPLPPQPPYGIDPLHFFIDLRVSGHIWDRNKKEAAAAAAEEEAKAPAVGPSAALGKSKHCSAFSVPQPRLEPREFGPARGPTSTHYVLQNLSRIYQDVKTDAEQQQQQAEDKPACKDLRALIGLELVVDYVKHEGAPKKARCDSPDDLDVVGTDRSDGDTDARSQLQDCE